MMFLKIFDFSSQSLAYLSGVIIYVYFSDHTHQFKYYVKEHVTGLKTDMNISGTEDPDINPCSYRHLIFDKGTQNTP
jgi:hypothetical protein